MCATDFGAGMTLGCGMPDHLQSSDQGSLFAYSQHSHSYHLCSHRKVHSDTTAFWQQRNSQSIQSVVDGGTFQRMGRLLLAGRHACRAVKCGCRLERAVGDRWPALRGWKTAHAVKALGSCMRGLGVLALRSLLSVQGPCSANGLVVSCGSINCLPAEKHIGR